MGLNLRWEDGRGNRLEEIIDPLDFLGTALFTVDTEGTICLRFIDPYDDTVFNQMQVPVLIEELKALKEQISDRGWTSVSRGRTPEKVRDHLQQLIELAERCRGEGIGHLIFIGD
jgi:hypothetical protein